MIEKTLIDEHLSEKMTTSITIFQPDIIADAEVFVQMKDLEKRVLAIAFSSFLVVIASIVI